jgi:hypothetical protein
MMGVPLFEHFQTNRNRWVSLRGWARIAVNSPERTPHGSRLDEAAERFGEPRINDGDGAFEQPDRQTSISACQIGQEPIPQNAEHSEEVVAQCHQAPFAADLVEAAHEEVPISGAAFECAEGMLSEGGPASHDGAGFCLRHARAMAIDHVLMLPAIHLPPRSLVSETTRAQRTYPTD